jgi:hypothetical protein
MGITRGSLIPYYSGDDGWLGTTNYTWLEFPDVKTWLNQAIAAEDKTESFQDAARTTIESGAPGLASLALSPLLIKLFALPII